MDKFLIAPLDSGLMNSVKPFAIPDQAFAKIDNAYSWRGMIVKRFGSELSGNGAANSINEALYSKGAIDLSAFLATLSFGVGQTDSTGAFTMTLPGGVGFRVGQYISIGTVTFTVTVLGLPAALTSSGVGAATLNTTTGALIVAGTAALADKQVIFYPYVNYYTALGYSGTLDIGTGIATGKVPGNKFLIGQQFSIGNAVFTVENTAPGNQDLMSTITLPAGDYATFDASTGIYRFKITALKGTAIFYYPSDPIMGLSQYEVVPVNNEPAFAFDTQFAYQFDGNRWMYSGPGPATYFHGTDSQFFWTCSYQGVSSGDTIMFVTNFNAQQSGAFSANDDPMWYWDGTRWNIFEPVSIPGVKKIVQARIIIPFKNHLLLMDTIERVAGYNTRYVSRNRFSWLGSPIGGNVNSGYPWYESGQIGYAGGGWVDAGTQESIRTAEYIKDRLIIGFERSTWEKAYTGNEVEPFQWNKLNTELGSESTFSSVPFDKQILTIGASGITACNGANVERIDENIPDYVFNIDSNNDGVARVHGVRDYKKEMVYWTMPIKNRTKYSYFPNVVLAYNYKTGSWAEFDDCITAFGYFEQSTDKKWQDINMPWEKCNFSWNSFVSMAKDRVIIAGNQQGYIFKLNTTLTSNARVMSITGFAYDIPTKVSTLKIMNHSLQPGDYIELKDLTGITLAAKNPNIPTDSDIHKVATILDKDTITLSTVNVTGGTYLGGGTCSRVSQIRIKSKQWNFYLKESRNFMVNKIDFLVTKSAGAIKTNFSTNSTSIDMSKEAVNTGTALGTYPYQISFGPPINSQVYMEQYQDRIWRTIFPQADGNFIQLFLYFTDEMMRTPSITYSVFELHAILLSAKPTGSIMEDQLNAF